MRFELPELKRFCFCFPLRYGLLVWGYFSLSITILFLYVRIVTLIVLLEHEEYPRRSILTCIYTALGLLDGVVNIIFIFAAHLKRVKLLKISLFCNIAFLSVYIIVVLYSIISLLYLYYAKRDVKGLEGIQDSIELVLSVTAMPFLRILFELYALLLLWNEIKKLTRNDRPIMFMNRAAEVRCIMETELALNDEGTQKEDQVQTAEVVVEDIRAGTDNSDEIKGIIESEIKINTEENEEKERVHEEPHSETAELLVEVTEAAPDNFGQNVFNNDFFDDFDTRTAQNPKVMEDDFGGEGLGFEPW
nr:uncharacterized protein LOC110372129 isoform X1 [Helicoverpa armigera]XP_049700628.1 uncharacterized protein LOC126055446 [Helicoverpa armigera]